MLQGADDTVGGRCRVFLGIYSPCDEMRVLYDGCHGRCYNVKMRIMYERIRLECQVVPKKKREIEV